MTPWALARWVLTAGSALGCQRLDVYAVTRESDAQLPSSAVSTVTSRPDAQVPSSAAQATVPAPDAQAPMTSASATASPSADGGATQVCPTTFVTPGTTTVTLQVGDVQRSYLLYVPAGFDASRPAPLIVDFHGAGSSAQEELDTSTYPALTDPEGVILVFPSGESGPIGNAWNLGPCCVPGVDDLAFVDALLADVKQRVCIDPHRTYAVGLLTGGGMAHYVACERADVFAAIAPSAFDLIEETVNDCLPAHPITVVAFRATADARVPYEGGSAALVPNMAVTFLGAEGSFNRWAQINGCTGAPSAPDAHGCSRYSQCADGVDVVLCTKKDAPAEPGDATIAWPILSQHRR